MWNQLTEILGGPANAYALSGFGGGGDGGDQSIIGMIFPFLMVFGIIYFLMIRPQQKKQKEQQAMLEGLKVNDNVVASGIYGEISRIKDDIIYVKIADNVRIRVMRSSITGLTSKEAPVAKAMDQAKDQAKDKAKDKSSD